MLKRVRLHQRNYLTNFVGKLQRLYNISGIEYILIPKGDHLTEGEIKCFNAESKYTVVIENANFLFDWLRWWTDNLEII